VEDKYPDNEPKTCETTPDASGNVLHSLELMIREKFATEELYRRCMHRLLIMTKLSSNKCNTLQRTAGTLPNRRWSSPS